jgi:hypothetical protein
MRFGRSKNRGARGDRLTLGLAAAALATAGTVLGAEVTRMARRRADEIPSDAGVLETAERALEAATHATQDSLTVAIEGYTATPRHETVLFNMLTGFTASFAFMRFSTWGIRSGWWPSGEVRVRGRHVHHFVPGILTAFIAGGAGLVTQNARLEETLAFPFGAGIGMTFDEAALLLQLEDVYWTREGLLSLQVSFGMAGLLGATILALRILRRGERQSVEAGLIPDESGEYAVPRPA